MSHLQTFQVFPCIPESLSFLETLSRNLWWCWHYEARELFRRIDPRLWRGAARRNAVLFLTLINPRRFEELAGDSSFLAYLQRVKDRFEKMQSRSQEPFQNAMEDKDKIAYFSMEFGIHESLPLYAGGLGILAGDLLKAASDKTLPMVAVGLLYRHGYFSQYLNQEGTQQEEYPETDIFYLPIGRARDQQGNELYVSVTGRPDGDIKAAVWQAQVGCVPLFLLDTNLSENSPDIRNITSILYAGDARMRLAQEALLGFGGMRALLAMGIRPTVCHMNEGHCSFAGLERLVHVVTTYGVDLKTALEIVSRTNVFTTHTPVLAGHDEFPADLIRSYLDPLQARLGIKTDEILSWGQSEGARPNGPLSMFVLGLRLSQDCNGVSRLHGQVARRMWAHAWPGIPEDEVPISHITNGVHVPSWISHELALLFERYLGPDWNLYSAYAAIAKRVDEIYDEELWRSHEISRTRLIRFCRERMVQQYGRRNAPKAIMQDAESVLDQDILTIGFARRFATYKRSFLLLMDAGRLEALITSRTQPIQFIFAGKAHPKDNEGKDLIKLLIQFAHKASVRHRFIFLEGYDPSIARYLVQGADVWLNTPRRPYEACGTSGMKAALNGVLNLSVLDGWWCEGYSEERGWRIGNGEEYTDTAYQDAVESQALYNILENEVIPCFYERKNGDVPVRWMRMMKASMKMAMENFCSHKMVDQYIQRFYLPAAERFQTLVKNEAFEAKRLRDHRERLQTHWNRIKIHPPAREGDGPLRVGETLRVTAAVHLGELRPDDVDVELYYGHLKSVEKLKEGSTENMNMVEDRGQGEYLYACVVTCNFSGRFGFTARVTPRGDHLTKFTPGLITWA